MKAALATLAVILSSLAASAQTDPRLAKAAALAQTTTGIQNQTLTLVAPCANKGKGLTLSLSGNVMTVHFSALTFGPGYVSFFYVGDLAGNAANGLRYYARGSHDESVADFVPRNPDGTIAGDGVYNFTDDFVVSGTLNFGAIVVEKFVLRHTRQFTVSNGGLNLAIGPDVVSCK